MIFSETAPAYNAAGLPVIPLVPGQKKPIPVDWTKYGKAGVDLATRRQWIAAHPNANIGLALGQASGLCALDVDGLDVATADRVLAALGLAMPWRRVGAKGFVAMFKWREGLKSFQVKAPDGSVLIELLGPGRQVVLPPSIHPDTGQPYTANCALLDVLADLPELPEGFEAKLRAGLAAEKVAMGAPGRAAVPAHGPIAAGGRDSAGVQEAGRLARAVLAGELALWEAVSEMECFCSRFEGSDKPDTPKFVAKLIEFLLRDSVVSDKGRTVYAIVPGRFGADGEPELEEVRRLPFGWDEGMDYAEKLRLGLDRVHTACGERYIARHCVLIAKTDHLVDTRTGDMMPFGVVLNGEVGPYVAFHPQTRKQEDTVRQHRGLRRADFAKMLPAERRGIVEQPPYKVFNTWRGFAVPTIVGVSSGDIEPFLRLLRLMFPDDREREHLLNWIAHLCQYPGVKMMHAILMISEAQGVGKGTLVGCICDLLHKSHRAVLTVGDVCSAFNAHWLPDRVLGFVDELQPGDRGDVTQHLKPLITSETVIVNEKHVRAYEHPNTINFIFASNKRNAVYLDDQDRRFFVLRIGDEDAARIQRGFDFTAFREWWDNILNRGRLLGWLLARDLAGFNAKGHAPMTAGKEALLDLTKPRWESVLQDALDTGAGVFGKAVVTVEAVVAFLAEHRLDKSAAHVRDWLRRAGVVPVLERMWVPRRGTGSARLQTTVWAVRGDAEHWRTAGRVAVLAELARTEFESRAERVRREAGGPHISKEGGMDPLTH